MAPNAATRSGVDFVAGANLVVVQTGMRIQCHAAAATLSLTACA
ncbi:MAG: hypothetical protein V4710_05780 [Verrucomicrobiota bacterium]